MHHSREMSIILSLVQNNFKIPVIYAKQNAKPPGGNYIVMYFIDESPMGFVERQDSKLTKQFNLQVCFDCIGKDAYDLASQLQFFWELEDVRLELNRNTMAFHKSCPLKNTTFIFDQDYEPRLSFEVSFYISKTITDKQNYIHEVNFHGINK